MSDSLYELCKNGYGDYGQVEKMPLVTYLTILRSDLISSIRTMAAGGTTSDEIAERTHLSHQTIQKILC